MLSIRPIFANSGTDSMLQFFTGAIDAAFVGITPFLLGNSYRLPIRIVSVVHWFGTGHGVAVKQDSLTGAYSLRLGTVFGSTGHKLGAQWAAQGQKDVSFINLSPDKQVKALDAGFIDGIASWEPFLSAAESLGCQRVFSALDDPYAGANLICATEQTITEHGKALRRFLDANHASSAVMESENTKTGLEFLGNLFDQQIRPSKYADILRDCYEWPSAYYFDDPNETAKLRASLFENERFLRSCDLIPASLEIDVDAMLLTEGLNKGRESGEIRIGYSESIMCAGYFLADELEIFDDRGIKVDAEERRLIERVAKFPEKTRADLRLIRKLVSEDPSLAVVKSGVIVEKLFSEVFQTVFSRDAHKVFGKTLVELEEAKVVPVPILSNAHWVRNLRNYGAHQGEVSATQATDGYNKLIDIIEWHRSAEADLQTASQRCQKCSAQVERGWKLCPRCGTSLESNCVACGEALQADWKMCPHCGVKR